MHMLDSPLSRTVVQRYAHALFHAQKHSSEPEVITLNAPSTPPQCVIRALYELKGRRMFGQVARTHLNLTPYAHTHLLRTLAPLPLTPADGGARLPFSGVRISRAQAPPGSGG